jgi:hypothetical protein
MRKIVGKDKLIKTPPVEEKIGFSGGTAVMHPD